MKFALLLTLASGLLVSGLAKADTDFAHAKDVLDLAANGEYEQGCKLIVKDLKNNHLLVGVQSSKGIMFATLTESNTSETKDFTSTRGTEHHVFKVGKSTTIEVLHNSDAFDKTTIKRGRDVVSCRNDY